MSETSPDMRPVKSSNLTHIGYDEASRELHVTYKSGKTYVWPDVDPDFHQRLMAAESHGKFMNAHVGAGNKHSRVYGP
jgi:hypothetical protein